MPGHPTGTARTGRHLGNSSRIVHETESWERLWLTYRICPQPEKVSGKSAGHRFFLNDGQKPMVNQPCPCLFSGRSWKAPELQESILFGQAGFIILRCRRCSEPCQRLAVLPLPPLRRG